MAYLMQKQADGMTVGEWNLAGKTLTFGHGTDVTARVDDRLMSRLHFRISPQGSRYLLQDLGSTNGTFVNGVRVTEAVLKANDQIKAGGSRFFFADGAQTFMLNLKQQDYRSAVADGSDQELLAKIAVESNDRQVRRAAVEKLTDPAVLARMGMWVKPELTQQVTDPALLAEIAVKAKDWAVRRAAVANLTDQPLLAQIASADREIFVRTTAVEKLLDQPALAQIALQDKEPEVRRAAIEMLTDQALLAKVAVTTKDANVRYAAVEKLTDQTVLAKLAEKDPTPSVRVAAIGKLTDQALLAKLAQGDPQETIRQAAAVRMAS